LVLDGPGYQGRNDRAIVNCYVGKACHKRIFVLINAFPFEHEITTGLHHCLYTIAYRHEPEGAGTIRSLYGKFA
jgi:hypothetical protein